MVADILTGLREALSTQMVMGSGVPSRAQVSTRKVSKTAVSIASGRQGAESTWRITQVSAVALTSTVTAISRDWSPTVVLPDHVPVPSVSGCAILDRPGGPVPAEASQTE